MKVLKSHRDEHFLRWNRDDFIRFGYLSPVARFEYVSIKSMQRGDVTQESEAWLKKNKEQNITNKIRSKVLKMIIRKNPRNRYLININPRNTSLRNFLKNEGFKLIQHTYEIPKKISRV